MDVNIVGIDVGTVLHRPTSGVCRTGQDGFLLAHTFIDKLSRQNLLGESSSFDLLSIDGPVLPLGVLHYDVRTVEKVFLWGAFRLRCAPGETRHGMGAAVRRAGCDTAVQFADSTCQSRTATGFPMVQSGRGLIEAFPNCFLGVMLPDSTFPDPMPKLKRGEKFEWLLARWRSNAAVQDLQHRLGWADQGFWLELAKNTHHEEQAGLVCALTGVCVHRNQYVAVGNEVTGYFFLPPWETWQPWAKAGLALNRRDPRLARANGQVEVWIAGRKFEVSDALP